MKHFDRVWAEVDLDAVLFNIESIKKKYQQGYKNYSSY